MAALSEHDLRVIHGENYRDVAVAESDSDKRRDARVTAREAIDTWSDRNFTSFAVFFLGCALLFSTLYATSPTAFQIQLLLALLLVAVGIVGVVYGRSRLKRLRSQLSDAAEPGNLTSRVTSELEREAQGHSPKLI